MLYLLLEIWLWIAGAGLIGALCGWWLRAIRARRQVAREAILWQQRLERQKTLATLEQQGQDATGPSPIQSDTDS